MYEQVLLSGGNGGFGKEILSQLQAKRIIILSRYDSNKYDGSSDMKTIKIDYLSPNAHKTVSTTLLNNINPNLPLLFISNAGSLSSINPASKLEYEDISNAMTINCSIPFLITSKLLGFMKNSLTIVNVSSLAAIQATPNMSLYCSSKASREMFFNTVLKEYPELRLLHYAPGPMDTDMQARIRNEMPEGTIRQGFIKMYQDNGLVDIKDSVKVMLELLNDGFENGSHVDYYDIRQSSRDNRLLDIQSSS